MSHAGACTIVGLECFNCPTPKLYEETFINHIVALRKLPMLAEATVVLILESNLGFEAHHIWTVIQKNIQKYRLGSVCCMRGTDGSPGLLTTHQVKEAACNVVKQGLEDGSLSIAKNLVCTHHRTSKREVLKNLREEFTTYSIVVDLPRGVFGKVKKTFSGKQGGNGQDDSIIATQLCLFWRREFMVAHKYAEWR